MGEPTFEDTSTSRYLFPSLWDLPVRVRTSRILSSLFGQISTLIRELFGRGLGRQGVTQPSPTTRAVVGSPTARGILGTSSKPQQVTFTHLGRPLHS